MDPRATPPPRAQELICPFSLKASMLIASMGAVLWLYLVLLFPISSQDTSHWLSKSATDISEWKACFIPDKINIWRSLYFDYLLFTTRRILSIVIKLLQAATEPFCPWSFVSVLVLSLQMVKKWHQFLQSHHTQWHRSSEANNVSINFWYCSSYYSF